MLYKSGDIETFGTDLRRIKRACDEQGVPVEVFQQGGFVHVRFTCARVTDGGLSHVSMIIAM